MAVAGSSCLVRQYFGPSCCFNLLSGVVTREATHLRCLFRPLLPSPGKSLALAPSSLHNTARHSLDFSNSCLSHFLFGCLSASLSLSPCSSTSSSPWAFGMWLALFLFHPPSVLMTIILVSTWWNFRLHSGPWSKNGLWIPHVFSWLLATKMSTSTSNQRGRQHLHQRKPKVYPKTIDLNASVEDPRIMGVIREQGGKVRLL